MATRRRHSYRATFLTVTCLAMVLASCGQERAVIVGFHETPRSVDHELLHRAGGKVRHMYRIIPAFAATLPEEVLAELANDPNVAYIEEDAVVTAPSPRLDDAEYDDSWGVAHIGSKEVHDQNVKGAGVKIAVLDTGIDYSHPDLDGNFMGGDNFISSDPDNHDPFDDSWNSHGTHVAGIIAAEQDGEGVVGVAPEASIFAVKVLDGAGFGTVSSVIAGIEWAVANEMDVASISIQVGMHFLSLEQACNAAYNAGLLLVAAAGNTFGGDVMYPAAYDSVIGVTATDMDDFPLPLSPVGPELELAAPGASIYSTAANGSYGLLSGTSQAGPHVAGVAALVLSSGFDQDLNGDGSVDNRDIRLRLQETALDMGEPGADDVYGYGLVSAGAAGPVSPASHLVVTRLRGLPWASAKSANLSDGIFQITIISDGLHKIDMKVFEDDLHLKELSKSYNFFPKGPSEVTFQMDSTASDLVVVFVPKGRPGASADVYIESL